MKVPTYSLQRDTNGKLRAYTRIKGKKYYLGRYDSSESREMFNRLVSEYFATDGVLHDVDSDTISVAELCAAFNDHAKIYYRLPSGKESKEVSTFATLTKIIVSIYGRLPASAFSPLKLKAVRNNMIKRDWSRKNININISRVRMIFSFGVQNELVDVSVLESLKTVRGLAFGRSAACETEKIKPAPVAYIEAVKNLVSRQVWAMIQLQLHTAARPGEICMMRICDIDMTTS